MQECGNESAWIGAGTMRGEQPKASLSGSRGLSMADTGRGFTVKWIERREASRDGGPASLDGHREASLPPDPAYPNGAAIDVALDAPRACRVELPCPAARCGMWLVVCRECGFAIALGTTGQADDPRSVRVPCRLH
jgi:hypothetical protein